MQVETEVFFNLVETEFKKLPIAKRKELLTVLTNNLEEVEKPSPQSNQRIPGLQKGKVWVSEDFDDELPDEFWGGRV